MSDEPVLEVGATGEWVAYLQRLLAEAGYWHGDETGYFDDALHASVLEYQTNSGLFADGVVRPEMWLQLTPAPNVGSSDDQDAGADVASPTPFTDSPSTSTAPASMAIILMTHRGVIDSAVANDEHVQFSALVTNPHQDAETGELEVIWVLDGEEVLQTYPSLAPGMSDWVLYAVSAIPAPGSHTIEVRWKPQGPYANFGSGQLTFVVQATGSQPAEPGMTPGTTPHQAGFGHTQYLVTDWGKLVYPSPAHYSFAASLDQDTQEAMSVFERLNHAWRATESVAQTLDDADAFVARVAGTFESELSTYANGRQPAEGMETQRQLAVSVGTQIEMINADLEKARAELDAAEKELSSVEKFEEARKMRDDLAARKREIGSVSDALNLAAKTLSNASDFWTKPLKVLEVAVQAFGNMRKLNADSSDSQAADGVQHKAVRDAMAAAGIRIESANRFIDSTQHIGAEATKNLTDATEFFVQLRSEAEQGYDQDNPGAFRFADVAREQTLAEQAGKPVNDLTIASESAQAYAGGLVDTYEQIRRHLEAAGESDASYVEALHTSSTTAKLMKVTANTMDKDATESARRIAALGTKLEEMHEKADYALSHHHPQAASH